MARAMQRFLTIPKDEIEKSLKYIRLSNDS